MIQPKIIKGIAFGAGCLLGMRSCLVKRLPTDSEFPYLSEIATHISEMFLAYGYAVDLDQIFNLRSQLLVRDPVRFKMFLNAIYCLYVQNRIHMHFIWEHFRNKEIDYNNFAAIKDHPAVKQFLLACIQCTKLLENLAGTSSHLSTECVAYIHTHALTQKNFNYLLKAAITLRLRNGAEATTPIIGNQSRRVVFAPGS